MLYVAKISGQETSHQTHSGNLSLTGTVQTGNSERVLLINTLSFTWNNNKGNTQFKTIDRYVYGTVGNFNKENDFRSANYVIFSNRNKWNPIVGLFFEKIKIKGIDAILKPMVGVQYKLIEKEKFLVRPQLMVGYAWKRYSGSAFMGFDNNGGRNINGTNINAAVNATIKPFNDKIILNIFSIYQWGIEESVDQRFWFDLNTQIPIWKGLYGRISFNNYFENINLEGTKKNDVNFSYGVGFKW